MLHRLLKPCPRCRGTHLLELKEDNRRAVKCMQCGYLLLMTETRFVAEDVVLEHSRELQKTLA
jgi:Zn ribbon nucleic-acid-binding protein